MNERLKIFVNFLIVSLTVKSQADFASQIGIARSQFSEILSGKRKITDKLVNKIHNTYPNLNKEWLFSGKGEMLNNYSPQINNSGEFNNSGDINNTINTGEVKAEDFFKLTSKMLSQIDMVLEQANRILTIIEKKL